MKREQFIKEWDYIVGYQLIDIISFKELTDKPETADDIHYSLKKIFNMLSKLKNDKFYNQKELHTIFYIVREDLYNLNDLFIRLNIRNLPSLVYEVIHQIFEELFLFCEDYELYETAQNLFNFRSVWFENFGVKYINRESEQK